MSNFYKPGGGNKPQPYIPAGNGDKSGEYTSNVNNNRIILNCNIKNVRFRYNFYNSKLVGKVTSTLVAGKGSSLSRNGKPNSVVKKIINGCVVTERYYNENGEVYLDIDYTCHGNFKEHTSVPHIHRWGKDANGKIIRNKWEIFQ